MGDMCIVCVIFQNLKKLANNLYQEQPTTQYKRLPCEQDKTCGMRGRGVCPQRILKL